MEKTKNFLTMFTQSIGVEEPWYIDRAEFKEETNEVHVYVRARETSKYECPECGTLCTRYDNEDKERVWRHGDVVFFPCYVHCRRPRVQCPKHGVHVVTPPWARAKSRFTLLFESYAMLLMRDMPVEKVRKILRCSHTALTGMLRYWVEKAVAEETLADVKVLCVDETSHRRGQRYVTVVLDGEARRVIDVEEGRDAAAVERFSYKLEQKGGDSNRITCMVSDMSAAYRKAREQCFPEATAVVDKFHVKKLLLDGVEAVRRAEQGVRAGKRGGSGQRLVMIPTAKLTQQQAEAIEALSKRYPKTGRAYRMVAALDEVYASRTAEEAANNLKKLISWLRRSRLEPMKKAGATLKERSKEILAYFLFRYTNAIAEGLNSMIQAAKRKARGFKTFRGFACMIYLVCGKLQLACPPLF